MSALPQHVLTNAMLYAYEYFQFLDENDDHHLSHFVNRSHSSPLNTLEADNGENPLEHLYPGQTESETDNAFWNADAMQKFAHAYDPFHKPLTSVICIFGVIANTLNILILTRKRMISPTNIILTGLSAIQLLLLLSYLSLLLFNYLLVNCLVPALLASYNWTVYKWVNVNINVAFHTTALGHTMCLTIIRFFSIKSPVLSRTKLTKSAARKCVLLLCIFIPIMCSPTFLTTYVDYRFNETLCDLPGYYDLKYVQSYELFQVTLWTFGVIFKLLPSLSIAVLSIYLIVSLKKIKIKKQLLMNCKESRQRKTQRQRLTKMLVAVALLCISVELPHGVCNLLTGIFGTQFGEDVYDKMGDFFEMLTLFYSSVNFVLYCLMSTQFQTTFKRLVIDRLLSLCCNVHKLRPINRPKSNNNDMQMTNEMNNMTDTDRHLTTHWYQETEN